MRSSSGAPPLLRRWQAHRRSPDLVGIHQPGAQREWWVVGGLSIGGKRKRHRESSCGLRGIRLSGPTHWLSAVVNRRWNRPGAVEVTVAFKLNIAELDSADWRCEHVSRAVRPVHLLT
jgi:hypothetical protein